MEAEGREVHIIQCAQQGQVTRWEEPVVERKTGWSDIWEWNTSRLSFLLRSTYDVVHSPVNLVRWKVQEVDKCMCGKLGTMKHIPSNCHLALKRYTWRHNEVLKVLTEMAKKQVEEGKYAPKPLKQGLGKIEFVPQGGKVPDRKKGNKTDVKWEVAADFKGCERFIPIPTTKKSGLVIWSEEEKEVHLVELTVPHEHNISSAHERKENRYEALVRECEEAGWKAMHFTVQVGCRGYIATSITKWMRVATLCIKKRNILTKALQETVEKT